MQLKSIRCRRKEMRLAPIVGQEYYLNQIITGQERVNVYLSSCALFISSRLIGLNNDGELVLSMPDEYQFRERRQSPRIVPDDPVSVVIETSKSSVKTNCNDLGTNGFSLLLSKQDRHSFKAGAHLSNVHIQIGESNIVADVLVVDVLKLKPYQLDSAPFADVRVSFTFRSLQKRQLGVLDKFIASYIQVR